MLSRCLELDSCPPLQKPSHLCVTAVRGGELWYSSYTYIFFFGRLHYSLPEFFPLALCLRSAAVGEESCDGGEILHLKIYNQVAFRAI